MVESCPKDSPGQKSLLEAAKAFGEAFDLPRLGSRQACDLRAAIAREEERPPATTDGERRCWEGLVDSWRKGHDEQRDRAQQAEANEQWLRNECNRIDRLVADERQRAEKAEAEAARLLQDNAELTKRAEVARKVACDLHRMLEDAGVPGVQPGSFSTTGCIAARQMALSERIGWLIGDWNLGKSERADVRGALAACLRPETQTGSARGDANVIAMVLQETVSQLLRAGYSAPLTVRATLPQVVDELLRLRDEAAELRRFSTERDLKERVNEISEQLKLTQKQCGVERTCRPSWARPRSRAAR